MIAVDTNILVYAHRRDSSWHKPAKSLIESLFVGVSPWAIPFPCIFEFYAVITHLRIYSPPTPINRALEQIAAWQESRSLSLIGEGVDTISNFSKICTDSQVVGGLTHDAKIVSICASHNISTLYTHDRDFSRFNIKTKNPFTQ